MVGTAIVVSALAATVIAVNAGLSLALIAYRVVTWTGAGAMLAVGAGAVVWWISTQGAQGD